MSVPRITEQELMAEVDRLALAQEMGIKTVEIDPTARTRDEIYAVLGGSLTTLDEHIRGKLSRGEWEEVRKINPKSGRRVKAYRPKR